MSKNVKKNFFMFFQFFGRYNFNSKIWELISVGGDGNNVLATFDEKDSFPIGLHYWTMKEHGHEVVKVKLSKVRPINLI